MAKGAVATYAFSNVTANHTIAATFTLNAFTIVASAGTGGTITPTGNVPVNCGASQSFTIAASSGYTIAAVTVDGVGRGAVASYTFSTVAANHTIAATFTAASGLTELVRLRADLASGSGPLTTYHSPWVDLTGNGHDATLEDFYGTLESGWVGNGTVASPYALKFGAYDTWVSDRASIPAASVPELQTVGPVSAELWFKTGNNAASDRSEYLLEWVQQPGTPANPATEGLGMSIAIQNGHLQVYLNPWAQVADVTPNTWYHVIVAKDAGQVRVYLNGQPVYTGADPHNGIQQSVIAIGASAYHTFSGTHVSSGVFDDWFTGSIAQVHIYRGAFTDAQANAEYLANSALYLPQAPLPTATEVLCYRADQANGTGPYTIPSATSPWVDLISPRNNGDLLNFNGFSKGWRGNGTPASPYRLEFDGTNDLVRVPAGTVAELMDAPSLSMETWVRPDNASSTSYQYVTQWLEGFVTSPGMEVAVQNGYLQIYLGWNTQWVNLAPVTTGTWYHVAIVKQPGLIQAFVNGALVYSGGVPDLGVPATEITIGASTYNGAGQYADFWSGAIAQYCLWRGAMTPAQVQAEYAADAAKYGATTAVDPQQAAAFALEGLAPNPASRELNVVFALPSSAPATLEMVDVGGRRVAGREVGSLGAGRHVVKLGNAHAVPAGVYWIRLTQGGQTLTTKAAVIR